jgi:Kef-type K+ transport system membrane component KefB
VTPLLLEAFIYLLAAVVAVPLAGRFGLGSVLGYLVAGVVIGPVLGLVGSEESVTIQHYAEFGVVMMLFLVGLELEPAMLWRMRNRLLGLGGLQVAVSAALFTLLGWQFGLQLRSAIAVGLLLSLSSTAIVLQTFQEKGLGKTEGARSAFSVLLFQDIAVIPMLALIPLLAIPELAGHGAAHHDDGHHELSLVAGLSGWAYALAVVAAIAAVVAAGQFLSRPCSVPSPARACARPLPPRR